MDKEYDLQERLMNFAVAIVRISEKLPKSVIGQHLLQQLVRSGTHAALHYGEAQSAESRKDFLHKMKVCLKELRETLNCLTLITRLQWVKDQELRSTYNESNELVSIFVTSVKTTEQNSIAKKRGTS